MISPEKIEEIKDANDIVDVVSGHLTLKKAGRNFKGLCPFHQEKTPSFIVSPEKQIFHCFGCNEGGNVFSFIQKTENVPFIESVKLLARRAGIALEYVQTGAKFDEKEKMLAINKDALLFFRENFGKSEQVKKYCANRGIGKEAIDEFQLGYAPGGGALTSYLKSKGYREDHIVKSFLANRKGNELYDIFSRRLMFPILSIYGDPIAFGGRVLDSSLPKYINSSETRVYIKGKNLYNLNNAKKYKEDYIAVVEGYTDAISLYINGIKNVAASLGTAFTEDQARLIKRYVSKVVLIYDMDDAGRSGAMRGGENLFAQGIDTYIVTFEGAKDPDEFIEKNGVEALRERIKQAVPFIDYKVDFLKSKGDPTSPYYMEKVLKEVVAILEKTGNFVVRNAGISTIASKLDVSEEIIGKYFKGKEETEEYTRDLMEDIRLLKEKGTDLAEKMILRVALGAFGKDDEIIILKHIISKKGLVNVEYADFKNRVYAGILKSIEAHFNKDEKGVLGRVEMDYVENSEVNKIISEMLAEASGRNEKPEDIIQVIDDCFGKIQKEKAKKQVAMLQEKIKKAETEKNFDDVSTLLKEKQEYQKIIKQRGEHFE